MGGMLGKKHVSYREDVAGAGDIIFKVLRSALDILRLCLLM